MIHNFYHLDAGDRTMREAVKLAMVNARTIKRMLLGILLYGKKVGEREFFLRRVTTLSLYTFGILSVLAKISKDLNAGVRNSSNLNLLRYLLEEAKVARCSSKRTLDTKKEKLGAAVFHDLNLLVD
jgi:acyl-CoA dehydrogenase family protein 9